jgi:hypothetical protein
MQFLPTTWKRYGRGGDIQATGDAILAAARLLRANGAPADMAGALYAYNPSRRAGRGSEPPPASCAPPSGRSLATTTGGRLRRHLLPEGSPARPPTPAPG